MVPSRSRKTAGRRDAASARSHLRRAKPTACCCFDDVRRDARHTAVVYRAASQKAWTAIWLFLHDGAARSDGRGAVWIARPKDRDNWQADCGSNMHCARIVADKKLAF